MITITVGTEGTLSGFHYLWLRAIHSFRYDRHCIGCLESVRYPRFHKQMELGKTHIIQFLKPYQYLYVCGGSWKGWANNFHLALKPEDGQSVEVETYNGIPVRVEGARALPIPALPDTWQGLGRRYTTCRNFRFAVAYGDVTTDKAQRELALARQETPVTDNLLSVHHPIQLGLQW
jgi:hypothetical protein